MTSKAALRLAIRERLARLSENDRRVESQVIVRGLREVVGTARVVAVYAPFKDEPDIRQLTQELFAVHKGVCMPDVERNRLIMKQIRSLNDIGRDPVTNIPKPSLGESIDEASIDLVIVPGRAFTVDGLRLGRGNGGYDHWITLQRKRKSSTRYIGVCFDCQIVQDIPVEGHDERVDRVVTSRTQSSHN